MQHQENTQDLHQIQDQIQKQGQQIDRIENKVDRFTWLVTGNELDKTDTGMIGKIKDHEIRIVVMEKKMDKFIYMLMGASAFGGIGIFKLLSELFAK